MRDRILAAAAKAFSQKGYHKTSMDEIAAQANVAKGSLYYHFRNKSELYRQVAEDGMQALRGQVLQALELPLPMEGRVAAVIDCVSSMCIDEPELFHIILSESPEGIDPEAWRQVQQARASLMEFIAKLLQEGYEYERIIRPLDFTLAAHALIGFVNAYRVRATLQKKGDRERMIREIREVIMHGLVTHEV